MYKDMDIFSFAKNMDKNISNKYGQNFLIAQKNQQQMR